MDYHWSTDGCSGRFMGALRLLWRVRYAIGLSKERVPPWEPDCEAHDAQYFVGGTTMDKMLADLQLAKAVAGHGFPALARCIFIGIGVGGAWWLPLPWRWGYGWKFGHPYQPREITGLAFIATLGPDGRVPQQ